VSIGVLAGATLPDQDFSNYQWDVTPQMAWGAQALAGTGAFSGGIRYWTSVTEQRIGALDAESADVRTSSFELTGRGRFAHVLGFDLLGTVSAGRVHLGWTPEDVTVSTGGGPVAVHLEPVSEWIGGGGLAAERALGASWSAGVEFESRFFGLDASHREGAAIVTQRETFGDLSARLHVARRFGGR
jgi:hypothetical protein